MNLKRDIKEEECKLQVCDTLLVIDDSLRIMVLILFDSAETVNLLSNIAIQKQLWSQISSTVKITASHPAVQYDDDDTNMIFSHLKANHVVWSILAEGILVITFILRAVWLIEIDSTEILVLNLSI